jgi:hypothetical protein
MLLKPAKPQTQSLEPVPRRKHAYNVVNAREKEQKKKEEKKPL